MVSNWVRPGIVEWFLAGLFCLVAFLFSLSIFQSGIRSVCRD